MQYVITFLEGIVTFISPCLLPMLPVYVLYFAGESEIENGKKFRTLKNACGFVLGFTVLFVALGSFASALGGLFSEHSLVINLVTGGIVVLFGLNYIGALNLSFLKGTHKIKSKVRPNGFFKSCVFGIVFAVGWTPCVGAFLGSAIMLAANQGQMLKGILLLLSYSLGLGIPFVLSAVFIDKLKKSFDFIKKHYKIVNMISGILLIVLGALMMSGVFMKIINIIQR